MTKKFICTNSAGDELEIDADYARINGTIACFYIGKSADISNELVASVNNYMDFYIHD